MKWNEIAKDWKNLSPKFKSHWTKLTDADLAAIAGDRDELVDRLAKGYKGEKAKFAKEVDAFVKSLTPAKV